MSTTIRTTIIGASGYTGAELIRLLYLHPHVEITQLIANANAGKEAGEIFSHLSHRNLPPVISLEEASWDNIDVVFCCLPHATTQQVVKLLPSRLKIIDLSADFRLTNPETYATWYGHEHYAPELQKEAVYGLTEMNSQAIAAARLVACPGCYPTCALLPLIPLVKEQLLLKDTIIIDAKSGLTGAGRSLKQPMLFCEMNENIKAYNIGQHRHIPEIEQLLCEITGEEIHVDFTPQIIPMSRGMLATIYVKSAEGVTLADIHASLTRFYANAPFVDVVPSDSYPAVRDVAASNYTRIGAYEGRTKDSITLVSVIDNLIKGASGQAVQNMNLMFGLEETVGLDHIPVFP